MNPRTKRICFAEERVFVFNILKMTKQRKFYQRRRLGSTRVDQPLRKKIEFIKNILTFNEPYERVSKDFQNFIKASVAADEEAELIHKLETLEVEEELNKEEEKEHFNDLMEAEESAGSSQAPKQPEKSEIQPKIDSFFSVKKISYLINGYLG